MPSSVSGTPEGPPTLGDLLNLLDDMLATHRTCGLSLATMKMVRSTWRHVTDTVGLSMTLPVAGLVPEQLLALFLAHRDTSRPFTSHPTYLTRLRLGLRAWQAYQDGADRWWEQPIARTLGSRTWSAAPEVPKLDVTRTLRCPIRPGLDLAIDIPWDLTAAEAAAMADWIRAFVRPVEPATTR